MIRIPTNGRPAHPGELLLEEFLKPMGITPKALADGIGVPSADVSELVAGKHSVTTDTALRLERFLGVSAQFWMNAQQAWDLYASLDVETGELLGRDPKRR